MLLGYFTPHSHDTEKTYSIALNALTRHSTEGN